MRSPRLRFRRRATTLLALASLLTACGRDRPEKSAESRPRRYACEYGQVVFFGLGGNSERLRLDLPGWSGTEKLFTWTEGTRASLGLRLPPAKRSFKLQFLMSGLINPPGLPAQHVDVSINGEKLASWAVAEQKLYTVVVPKRFAPVPDSYLRIDFDIPQAISPAALGHSNDTRQLGLCVREMRIKKPAKRRKPETQAAAGPFARTVAYSR